MEKKIIKDVLKIFAFIALVNLPFITTTQLIGMDVFIDSFENPESYQYFKSSKMDIGTVYEGYLVIQRSSHPHFSISIGDTLFYLKDEGGLGCQPICRITNGGSMKKYYVVTFDGRMDTAPIYDYQVIGKVVNSFDNNAWNKLSLTVWDASINNLNAVALFTNN